MRRITTLNSVYEYDEENRRFRRITGKNDPTPRFEKDGLWHEGIGDYYGTRFIFTFAEGGYTTLSAVVSDEQI